MSLKPSDYGVFAGMLVIGIVLVIYLSRSLVAPFLGAVFGFLGVLLYMLSRAGESFLLAMCSVIFFAAIGIPLWFYASDVGSTLFSAILSSLLAYFGYRAHSLRGEVKKAQS
jgi:hypothetical protein